MTWLLDTCVLSEYIKKVPAPKVIGWLDEQDETSLFISVISLGEIEKSIINLQAGDPVRARKLRLWLGKLEQRFSGRILPLDTTALSAWARLSVQAELMGKSLPVMDGLLMATAQSHGLTVVTRNIQDFDTFPCLFNPWAL